MDSSFCFKPIGVMRSPFKDKYGIPRQPSLVSAARGTLQFQNDPDILTALNTLDQFSHLWVLFVFHQHGGKKWKPSIRPPRLGGRTKVGVLASRSPHRPNPIGLSVVKIAGRLELSPTGPELPVSGLDLLDNTPILDVKPYLPYADSYPQAVSGWASEELPKYPVQFSEEASRVLEQLRPSNPDFQELMVQMLEIDPRPGYQKRKFPIGQGNSLGLQYGIAIAGFEVKYALTEEGLLVLNITAETIY